MSKTRMTVGSRGEVMFGALNVGGGTTVKKIQTGTVSVNPPSIATVSRGVATATITGVRVGDKVYLEPPATLNDDLLFVGARVTANDTVSIYLYNPTVGAIDDGALTWDFVWLKF